MSDDNGSRRTQRPHPDDSSGRPAQASSSHVRPHIPSLGPPFQPTPASTGPPRGAPTSHNQTNGQSHGGPPPRPLLGPQRTEGEAVRHRLRRRDQLRGFVEGTPPPEDDYLFEQSRSRSNTSSSDSRSSGGNSNHPHTSAHRTGIIVTGGGPGDPSSPTINVESRRRGRRSSYDSQDSRDTHLTFPSPVPAVPAAPPPGTINPHTHMGGHPGPSRHSRTASLRSDIASLDLNQDDRPPSSQASSAFGQSRVPQESIDARLSSLEARFTETSSHDHRSDAGPSRPKSKGKAKAVPVERSGSSSPENSGRQDEGQEGAQYVGKGKKPAGTGNEKSHKSNDKPGKPGKPGKKKGPPDDGGPGPSRRY